MSRLIYRVPLVVVVVVVVVVVGKQYDAHKI